MEGEFPFYFHPKAFSFNVRSREKHLSFFSGSVCAMLSSYVLAVPCVKPFIIRHRPSECINKKIIALPNLIHL